MHVHAPLDHLVFSNAWRHRCATEKLLLGGGLLLEASILPVQPWSPAIFMIAASAALYGARIPFRSWLRFLAPQAAFLAAACLPFLFTLSPFGWQAGGVEKATQVLLRGLAAASCLTLLSLTTPIPDLLQAGRGLRVPAPLIELAFLVYRLLCSCYELLGRLRLGLDLRLNGRPLRLDAVSLSAGNLLVRSLETAKRLERGASIRGLEGYRLLTPRRKRSPRFMALTIAMHAGLLGGAIVLGRVAW